MVYDALTIARVILDDRYASARRALVIAKVESAREGRAAPLVMLGRLLMRVGAAARGLSACTSLAPGARGDTSVATRERKQRMESTVGAIAPVRVLGIGGSTRHGSMSLLSLTIALKVASEVGAETRLAAVRDLDLPMYNGELHLSDYPPSLHWLLDEVRAADAFIICSPTYHGTISGAVKNVLDSLEFLAADQPRYLGGKAVALLGYGGASAMNVINSLYHTVRTLNS